VIRTALAVLALLAVPLAATAQQAQKPDHPLSVGTGIGFVASETAFLFQLDANYKLTDSFSVGPFFQVAPYDLSTLISLAIDGRYHVNFLHSQKDQILNKVTPYVGLGAGFTHLSIDNSSFGESAFLISILMGLEYDITEHIAFTSDMRFNIAAGDLFGDSFYYSWQILGARYRF